MKKQDDLKKIRLAIVGVSFCLLTAGLFFLTTTSAPSALARFDDGFHFLKRQFWYGLLPGLVLGLVAYKIPLERFRRFTPYLFAFNLLLLLLLFFPFLSATLGGSRRWLQLGPISFQPAEFLKITFILYFSHLAAKFIKREDYRKLFLVFVGLLAVIGTLIAMQPDLSTLGVIVATGLSIYLVSGMPFGNIMLLLGLMGGTFWLLTRFSAYQLARLITFFNPSEAPLAAGYQIKQMLYAIGSGQLFGLGLGLSRQKFGFLPHSISDSIFAIIAEETGFVGSTLLVLLFAGLAYLGFRLALGQTDRFRQLMMVGLTTWISFQAFVHIAANVGLIPLTGMPLPFISYGGSALTAQLIGLGLLLNVSKK